MKPIQSTPVQEDVENLTIPEAEEMIEEALEELAFSNDPGLTRALRFLAPPGYQAIVELCGENGRSKRRNASATSWTPEEDEVRIYFERIGDDGEDSEEEEGNLIERPAVQARTRPVRPAAFPNYDEGANGNVDDTHGGLPPDIDDRIKELCATLAEAERGGHAFIALKWFRDSFLPRKSFNWNQNPESRQMILAEAILRGVVMTSKIPNPKTPAYPTTTIRLNRAEAGVPEEAQRFRPVSVQGESVMLDDDRGEHVSCYFLDSTAFVKLFVQEAGTNAIIRLMEATEDNRKLISAGTPLEVYAALKRRERAGGISFADSEAARNILRVEAARMVQQPLNPAVLEAARQLLDRHELRSAESLQLGAAVVAREMFQGMEITFVSADNRLLEVARLEYFATLNPTLE